MAVLPFTATLTDKFTLSPYGFPHSFPIGNLGSAHGCFDFIFPEHSIDQDFQVQFSHPGDYRLIGFGINFDPEGGILIGESLQSFAEFLDILFGFRFHRHGDNRFGDKEGF